MKVKEAQKAVRDLEAERARLVARVAELEARRDDCPVDGLGALVGELGACRDTLPIVDERLTGARAALRDAQQAEREAGILALRPRESKVFDKVVDQVLVLKGLLDDLHAVRRDLSALGAGPEGATRAIADGVWTQLKAWEVIESLGGRGAGRKLPT